MQGTKNQQDHAEHDPPSLYCTSLSTNPNACPRDVINCTCRVSGIRGLTRWKFIRPNRTYTLCENNSDTISLEQLPNKCIHKNGTCGDFLYAQNEQPLSPNSSCQTSTLKIIADPILDGLPVTCHDTSYGNVLNTTLYPIKLTG